MSESKRTKTLRYIYRMESCTHCRGWLIRENELARDAAITSNDFERLWKVIVNAYRKCPIHGLKQKPANGKPKGLFAGTLTKSTLDDTTEEQMIVAIEKIMKQQTTAVKRFIWYLEYTQNGTPHIHFVYECDTGGRIHQKVFKRYWKTWDESVKCGAGFRGGYHKLVTSEIAYTEYIAKDASVRHGIKWDAIV